MRELVVRSQAPAHDCQGGFSESEAEAGCRAEVSMTFVFISLAIIWLSLKLILPFLNNEICEEACVTFWSNFVVVIKAWR